MNKEEMINKVIADHKSKAGYNFDPAKVKEIIETGVIPEGTILTEQANQTVKFENGAVVLYVDGKVAKTMDDERAIEGALMTYAYIKSNIGN